MWHTLDLTRVTHAGGRNGKTKFLMDNERPLRFQIPRAKVLFGGLSNFKSVTLEMPDEFAEWWRTTLEPALTSGLTPFRSNMNGKNLRVKVDTSTQIFDSSRTIKFPELVEGAFAGLTVTCIIEITGTYFFQETYGLVCRVYQLIEREQPTPVTSTSTPGIFDDETSQLKGFSFLVE